MTDDATIEALKAIAHPLRFQIVQHLRRGEMNVGEIEQASSIAQPALSQQLGVLRKAGLVETRKQAKLVFYRLDEHRMRELGDLIGGNETGPVAQSAVLRKPAPGVANFARLS
jgi:DNA-binding transcriptional ArsR family regulator